MALGLNTAMPLFESIVHHHSDSIPELLRSSACCLGVDEAGRGPVLGPMVYGIAFCPVGRQMELRERGMDDSKKLTHETRQMLFDKGSEFNDWFGWSVHALSPQDISSVMLRRDKYNLNTLSHDTTIGLIKSALDRGVNVTEVYVDTVGSPEKYQVLLSTHFPQLKITVAKKADSLYPIKTGNLLNRDLKSVMSPSLDRDIRETQTRRNGFLRTCNLFLGFPGLFDLAGQHAVIYLRLAVFTFDG
eukprot:Partr_v1_DN25345_c0_g1_i2_m21661 putative Endonuclease that specifically degrades the RNA of RNA- DNA hybrids (By similarity)